VGGVSAEGDWPFVDPGGRLGPSSSMSSRRRVVKMKKTEGFAESPGRGRDRPDLRAGRLLSAGAACGVLRMTLSIAHTSVTRNHPVSSARSRGFASEVIPFLRRGLAGVKAIAQAASPSTAWSVEISKGIQASKGLSISHHGDLSIEGGTGAWCWAPRVPAQDNA